MNHQCPKDENFSLIPQVLFLLLFPKVGNNLPEIPEFFNYLLHVVDLNYAMKPMRFQKLFI